MKTSTIMLKKEERNRLYELYQDKKKDWEEILLVYIHAGYDDSSIFRKHVMNLKYDQDKRICFQLMDKIDRLMTYENSLQILREAVNEICKKLNLRPSDYSHIIDNYKQK